jgi:ATP-dependent helicase HrpA
MIIVAGLSIQDPRERPSGKEQAAAELHGRFAVEGSDFLAYLRLWEHVTERQRALSSSQFRRLCRQEHLNHQRIREWQDVRGQLRQVAQELGLHPNTTQAEPDAIHRALLAGMLSHVGLRADERESREYRGARNARFAIARGSVLAGKPPRWVMAAELVETNRLWGRVVARIQPDWAERLAAHLVQRAYGEPRWDARRAAATVDERVTLYGLPIVAGRPVPYSRIDPSGARHAFIGHALVDGDWAASHPFLEGNRKVLEEVRSLAERARRRDLLLDDDALVAFYDDRVPAEVTSGHTFDRWWSRARRAQPELLTCTVEALVGAGGVDPDSERHPEVWHQGDLALDLSYGYEPGAPDDGVTVHVPLAALDQVSPDGFDWQVPPLREELIVALVRALPKPLRRHFVPVPDTARAVLDQVGPSDGPLLPVVARALSRLAGVAVGPDDFDLGRLPGHLRATFQVVDDGGAVLAAGKDLDELKGHLRPRLRASVAAVAPVAERTGQRAWTFGTIPQVATARLSGHDVEVFPALVDEGDSVGLRLFTSRVEQAGAMGPATLRLLMLSVPSAVTTLRRRLDNATSLALAHSPYPDVGALCEDCVAASVQELLDEHGGPAWDDDGFERLRLAVRAGVDTGALAVVGIVAGILTSAGAVEQRLAGLVAAPLAPAVADMRAHLARLVHPGFVVATGASRLSDVHRYVQGIERRAEKVAANVRRDAELMMRARELEASGGTDDEVRWMIEELRVSFFAQALGTKGTVSEQRIRRRLAG